VPESVNDVRVPRRKVVRGELFGREALVAQTTLGHAVFDADHVRVEKLGQFLLEVLLNLIM